MDIVLSEVSEWLKEVLISGILDNLTNLFATVNDQVGSIATDMAVFDVAQNVIASSSDVIVGSTAVSELDLEAMQTILEAMEEGPLLGLYLQSAVIGLTMRVLTIAIFIIV